MDYNRGKIYVIFIKLHTYCIAKANRMNRNGKAEEDMLRNACVKHRRLVEGWIKEFVRQVEDLELRVLRKENVVSRFYNFCMYSSKPTVYNFRSTYAQIRLCLQ